MANQKSLNLYAKVEDLLGVQEASPKLYAHYLLFLQGIESHSLLDVGCGSGTFLKQMDNALSIKKLKGIDLSPLMVEKTLTLGYEAQCIALEKESASYSIITAVFDMLNYLNKEALALFLKDVVSHLNEGGYFLCDINTLYGFENVAVGSFIVDDEERFLTIDSDFEAGEYISEFTLFEKELDKFKKSQEIIKQYHHSVEEITKLLGIPLILKDEVFLYEEEEADKLFLVFQKKFN